MERKKIRKKIEYKLTCAKCGWFHTENSREILIRATSTTPPSRETEKIPNGKCINCGVEYNFSRDIKVIEE